MAFVLCALVGIVGCSSSSSSGPSGGGTENKANALVGTWEGREPELPNLALVFTFAADGKVTQETVIEGLPKDQNVKVDNGKQEGTYKHEDKTITITLQGKEKKLTIKESSDSKMVLTNPEGKDMTFTKKK